MAFLWKMAWRDSRRSRGRLILFTTSIILGVAALVAINSFGENLQNDIDDQSKELLGADMTVSSNRAPSDSATSFMDSLGGVQAKENVFSSMAYFPAAEATRAVQVHALTPGYPFYGELETIPANAGRSFLAGGQKALVDQTLMLQFEAQVGDSIQVGQTRFEIVGRILKVPGYNGLFSAIFAPVYIPMDYLSETDLVKKGSRVTYRRFYQFPQDKDVDALVEAHKERFSDLKLGYDTVRERKEGMGNAFDNLTRFLNLVAFLGLLMGCVGVASSVHVYIKDKIGTVAILRCLGTSGGQAFLIYLIQVGVMGLIGSILGALLGSIIQIGIPFLLQEFLPVTASTNLSWAAIGSGMLTGVLITLLFGLLPLLAVRRVSPLYTLRASFETKKKRRLDPGQLLVGMAIALFIGGFAYLQIDSISDAANFVLAILVGFGVLSLLAGGIMWAVRRFFPKGWSYIWRQSLANLFRPQNQTLIMVVSIGIGSALIALLFFIQHALVNEIAVTGAGERPNMVMYDVQPEQVADIKTAAAEVGIEILQDVPVVNMQLSTLRGRSPKEWKEDTTDRVRDWVISREYRVTYRDSIIDTEKIVAGSWNPGGQGDSIFISVEERLGRDMQAELGDEVVFDVSGRRLTTYIGSFRNVNFARVQPNFLVLFPKNALEKAPQFRVLVSKTRSDKTSARFQQYLALNHPTVSVIDLALVLRTAEDILSKLAFVIQFMAFFSIAIGLIVLIGSVINSKYQRIQESVLLRTLGANRRQIFWINALEYIMLGSLASVMGILLALLGSYLMITRGFENVDFTINPWAALGVWVGITALTVLVGSLNLRGILNKAPLEVLRKEV